MRALTPKFILSLLAVFAAMPARTQQQGPPSRPAESHAAAQSRNAALTREYGKLPLSFEANQGQVNSQVRFLSRGEGYSLFLTDREAVLSLRKRGASESAPNGNSTSGERQNVNPELTKTDVVRMQLVGASPQLRVIGSDQLPGKANYFIGNDPAKWHSNVPTFGKVQYTQVYPGMDLVYYGDQRQLEFDFVVAPLADSKQIRLQFDGAKKLKLDTNGDLEVIATNGQIAFHRPTVYQEIAGRRKPIEGQFTLLAKNTIGFSLGSYNPVLPLVIDPVLAYSTYLGGTQSNYNGDQATAIAVDSAGDAYIAGLASSNDFPTIPTSYQPQKNSTTYGAFITELDPTGSGLIYATFIGGTTGNGDQANAIALDSTGNAYITGSTQSANFPVTPGAPQQSNNTILNDHLTGFVTKLNAGGASLGYSTYLGGSTQGDSGFGIAVDSEGSAYVTGIAVSTDFPVTSGTFVSTSSPRGTPLFVTKYNPSGSQLAYSALLFGNNGSQGNAIAVDGSGNAYVTGYSVASNYPTTTGAFETGNPIEPTSPFSEGKCAIVTKLSPDASALLYSTYLCGLGTGSQGNGLAIDSEGSAYITGFTTVGSTPGDTFPTTPGAYKTAPDGDIQNEVFLTKMKPDGSGLAYSTYIDWGTGNSVALDSYGNAAIAGVTNDSSFPQTADAIQPGVTLAGNNAFISKLNDDGSQLVYSTLMGTNDIDQANAIAVDAQGDAYVVGYTTSSGFPTTTGALLPSDPQPGNNYVGFVSKLSLGGYGAPAATTTTLTSNANPQSLGSQVTFTASVQPVSGAGTPTGTVAFSIDGGVAAAVPLDDTGLASYSTSTLTVGAHTVDASYSGNANYAASSDQLTENIIAPPASIVLVSGSGQTTPYGSAFASPLVVIVRDASGNPVSGAVVTFSGSGLNFASTTATTGSNGEASVTATAIASGSLTASASTTGVTGTANFSLTATKVALTVTAANASVAFNQPIPAFTYSVTGFVNGDTSSVLSGAPAETTTATQGSAAGTYPIAIAQGSLSAANYTFSFVNGTLTINSLATAAAPAFSPAEGTYTSAQSISITDTTPGAIIYYTTNGSTPTSSSTRFSAPIPVDTSETIEAIAVAPGYSNSAVATATYTINLPAASFSLTSSPSSATVGSGQSATITLTVTPANGFTQAVKFACAGLPSGYECSFAPSTVTPSGAAVTSTMTIASNANASISRPFPWQKAAAGFALALLLWPLGWRKYRYRFAMLVLIAAAFVLAGCGSPKPQIYTVSITASGGGITGTSSLTLTVTQ